MLTRFLLTLASSWLANPIGVLIANAAGAGSDPTLLRVLLGVSAAAPFQLYANEALATAVIRGRSAIPYRPLGVLLTLQFAVTVALLAQSSLFSGSAPLNMLVSATLCANTFASFGCALLYYGQAASGYVNHRQAIVIGALPGLVNLVLLVGFSALRGMADTLATVAVLASCVVPTLLQLLYLWQHQERRAVPWVAVGERSYPWLGMPLLAIMLLAFASAALRSELASAFAPYASIALVVLGLVVSSVSTIARARHIAGHAPWQRHTWLVAAAACAIASACAAIAGRGAVAQLAALVGAQVLLVACLAWARHLQTDGTAELKQSSP